MAVLLFFVGKFCSYIRIIRTNTKAGFFLKAQLSQERTTIIRYIGKSQYSFTVPEDTVEKEVHWYLMMGESYYSKPQREEFFVDSGFYKYHEAYHLLKFSNEKQILEKAYNEYLDLKKSNLWGTHKYY